MPKVSKSIIASYSSEQIYSLVTDIESYPQFINACTSGTIDKTHTDGYTATLNFRMKGVGKSFTTRNIAVPCQSITMELVKGPFKYLNGSWRFTELDKDACKIEFVLDYEFSSGLLSKASASVFRKLSESMVQTFHEEAKRKFGSSSYD